MKPRKATFVVVLTLGLAVVAALAWVLLQDADRFRPQLAAVLSEATGMPVALDGPMTWSWQPALALQVSQVSLHAPSMSVRIAQLEVRANTAGLLRGHLRLQRLFASDVTVDLQAAQSNDAPGALPDPSQLPLDRLEIENLRLQRNGQPWLHIERLTFDGTADSVAPKTAQETTQESTTGRAIPVEVVLNSSFAASARMQVDGGHVLLHDLLLRTPAGELRGMIDVEPTARPPRMNARLQSDRLVVQAAASTQQSERVIPRVALDLSALKLLDAQVDLAVATLILGDFKLHTVVLPASLQRGRLQVAATAGLGGGSVKVDSDVHADEQRWTSHVQLAEANAGALFKQLGLRQVRDGGVLTLKTDLDASGAHTDALLGSLRGDVSLRLSGVNIDAGAVQMAGADIFSGLMHMLRGTGSQAIKLSCAVADFKVGAGILRARDSIGAQTAVSNLLGGGEIDLPRERMDLLLRPWPREGLGLSATALSGAVSVSGPLRQPRLALTGEAVLRTGATAGAAVLTGGLSLIAQGLLERARGDTPCEQAMGLQKVERGSGDVATTISEGTKSVAKSVGRGAKSVVESVGEGVQGLGQSLKGLFGGDSSAPSRPARDTD